MMCGWKDCLCCSFWTSISMNEDLNVFDTCFISSASVELELRVFCRHPYQWMTAFTHRQLQNVLLTLHWHSPCETVAIDSWIVAIQEKDCVGVWIKIAIFFTSYLGSGVTVRYDFDTTENIHLYMSMYNVAWVSVYFCASIRNKLKRSPGSERACARTHTHTHTHTYTHKTHQFQHCANLTAQLVLYLIKIQWAKHQRTHLCVTVGMRLKYKALHNK